METARKWPLAFNESYRVCEETGCWLWIGAIDARGYGRLLADHREYSVSRLSYTMHKGPMPSSRTILKRSCGVRRCVNPDHLFLQREYYEIAPETGCWNWRGQTSNGYGMLVIAKKRQLAHRWFYRKMVGPIPDGAVLCHRCDNPRCVNPAHLFVGNQSDNLQDMIGKGRGLTRLSRDDIPAIRSLIASGASDAALGEQFDVSRATIADVRRGVTWRSIP